MHKDFKEILADRAEMRVVDQIVTQVSRMSLQQHQAMAAEMNIYQPFLLRIYHKFETRNHFTSEQLGGLASLLSYIWLYFKDSPDVRTRKVDPAVFYAKAQAHDDLIGPIGNKSEIAFYETLNRYVSASEARSLYAVLIGACIEHPISQFSGLSTEVRLEVLLTCKLLVDCFEEISNGKPGF